MYMVEDAYYTSFPNNTVAQKTKSYIYMVEDAQYTSFHNNTVAQKTQSYIHMLFVWISNMLLWQLLFHHQKHYHFSIHETKTFI